MNESETKELLLLAAKAVNKGLWHPLTHEKPWQPHIDDGDSARLRTKLLLGTYWGQSGYVRVSLPLFMTEVGTKHIAETATHDGTEDSKNAALRLATLKCAAEIGRRMG